MLYPIAGMSFKSFNLQSLQESLNYESLSKSLQKMNPGKYSDQVKESLQPLATKTTQLISSQVLQLQQLSNVSGSGVEVSELPVEYLQLEANCDLLLKLYTDMIQFTNDTFAKVSYDYPPGNYALSKLRDSNVGGIISSKFSQLKNVSSPQEIERILNGAADEDEVEIQTTSVQLPKTLYGQLSQLTEKHGQAVKDAGGASGASGALSLSLAHISAAYLEIASARLDMDKRVMAGLNGQLVLVLNEQFIKVNELRKQVYANRLQFDALRASVGEDDENEDLIKSEDELVSATEVAVTEMKRLLKPSKTVSLLKVFVDAQKAWFETGYKKLSALSESLDKVDVAAEEEDDD